MGTHVAQQTNTERIRTLPPTAIAAGLVAMLALWLACGQGALLLLGVALVLSSRASKRLESGSSLVRLARLGLLGIVLATAVLRFRATDSDPIEMILAWSVGLACACEMTIQAWLHKPLGGARGVVAVFLSGMVMMAASNTYETRFIRFLAPLYMLLLALSLHEYSCSSAGAIESSADVSNAQRAKRRAQVDSQALHRIALVLAISLGAIVHWGVWRNRFELTQWGARLLREAPRPESVGLSTAPRLGATFGEAGGLGRVMRIEGKQTPGHWRALSFDTYDNGRWTPLADKRTFEPFAFVETASTSKRRLNALRVERLLDDRGLIFAPLGVQNIAPPRDSKLEWARDGGPLRSVDPAPLPYLYDVAALPDEDAPSRMSTHVAAQERVRCLQVPDSVSPQVRALARRIGGTLHNSRDKVQAVQSYLMSRHAYSLRFNPGAGDPVSNFLMSDKGAHCEYFAASTVLLLRCLDVPTRYVIGYYAHENDGLDATVVRSRDAHAWAESYVDNRWISVDSTPGDGRPDKTGEPLPFWLRVRERVQEAMRTVRNWVAQVRQSPRRAFGPILVLLALVAPIAWLRLRRRSAPLKTGFAYAAPDAQLQALALRFERAMHKRGFTCPPQQTWDEYLSTMDKKTRSKGIPNAISRSGVEDDTQRAARFVTAYNAARFGGAAHEQLDELRALLHELETQRPDSGLVAAKELR